MKIKRKRDYTVAKIVGLLLVMVVGAVAVYKLAAWFRAGDFTAAASAAVTERLVRAEEAYRVGDYAGAKTVLEPVLDKSRRLDVMPRALILMANIESAGGNAPKALNLLEQAYAKYRNSSSFAETAVAYARALESNGRYDEAGKIYEEVVNTAPPELRAPALAGLGRKAEREKDLLRSRELYRQAVREAAWNSDAWRESADALGRVNVALIFSPAATPESQQYAVKPGDSITSIGNALNTTQGLLTRANGINETTPLQVGRLLKYTPKDFRIIIERSKCRLFLVDKDGLFKWYPVGLGKPGHETTLGSYRIGNKEKDPIWHKPGEGPIPAGDPRNELGTRWMPLVPDQEGLPKDLGIHGTIRPETIGLYTSNGCARMFKEDVEELYDLVVRATPVDIVETVSPDELVNAGKTGAV